MAAFYQGLNSLTHPRYVHYQQERNGNDNLNISLRKFSCCCNIDLCHIDDRHVFFYILCLETSDGGNLSMYN